MLLQCYIALELLCRLVLVLPASQRGPCLLPLSQVTHGSGTPYIRDSISPYDDDNNDDDGDADDGIALHCIDGNIQR